MGRGSLGEVLPAAVTNLFVQAAASASPVDALSWTAGGGRVHRFRTLRDNR